MIAVLYAPVFGMGFVTDDFIEVGVRHDDARDFLARDDVAGWWSKFVERALIDPVSGTEMFRPTRQFIFTADYFMWYLDPVGYHITNLLLLLAACFVVALLAWQLTRRTSVALVASLLFALHPVHTAPVSEMSSRGHVIAGLFVALTVLFYALPRTRRNTLLALLSCVLAVGSKETALTTPLLLALYEVIYHREELRHEPRRVMLRQLPFWLIVAGAVALRLVLFGRLSSRYAVGSWSWEYQVQGYSLFALAPFFQDITLEGTFLFFAALVIAMVLYRSRRQVRFGILWTPLALLGTLAYPPQERYFFTASIGLAIAFGSIVAQPFGGNTRWARAAGLVVTAAVCLSLGAGSIARIADFRNAGEIVQTVLAQVKTLHPTMPRNARLYFVGLPEVVRKGYVFNNALGVQYVMQWLYDDRSLRATNGLHFPVVFNALDRTFFFEYERRKITERADLVQALRERVTCSSSRKAIVWNFGKDAGGWQAWNEMEAFQAQDGALHLRTNGNDPFMGSPFIEVPPRDLERIEIQMRAKADKRTLNAEVYWQTAEMPDFASEARTTFQVNADEASRKYVLPFAVRGDAPIVRLRFDPTDAPAEIQIERIALYCR